MPLSARRAAREGIIVALRSPSAWLHAALRAVKPDIVYRNLVADLRLVAKELKKAPK